MFTYIPKCLYLDTMSRYRHAYEQTVMCNYKNGGKMRIISALIMFYLSFSNAYADFTDGNELQQWLSESEATNESRYHTGIFRGYVGGVVDIGNNILFCTGSGVTRGQYTAVVKKYIKNNPEKWNIGASSLVIEAMKQAFPCKK